MPHADRSTTADESVNPTGSARATAADYAAWRERIRTRRQEKTTATESGHEAARPPGSAWSSGGLPAGWHDVELDEAPAADLWDQIGVSRGATLTEVAACYRQIAKSHHPDLHMNADEITQREHAERFRSLTTAYQALRHEIES